jgi:hypothetical protein
MQQLGSAVAAGRLRRVAAGRSAAPAPAVVVTGEGDKVFVLAGVCLAQALAVVQLDEVVLRGVA